MTIPFPAYRPARVELQLPNYRVLVNNWRAAEWPEILGSIPEGAVLRLSYENITDAEALELLLLQRATAGGRFPLDPLPAEVAAGITDANLANRLLDVAPLVWTVSNAVPRQDSRKAGRSSVDIELTTELRFSQAIVIPTVACPAWVAREDVGCLGGGGGEEPEIPNTVPEMWLSRLETETNNASELPAVAGITSDGGTFHAAWVRLADDSTRWHMYVIRRDPEGTIIWQKRFFSMFDANAFANDYFTSLVTPDDNFVIGHIYGREMNRTIVPLVNGSGLAAEREIFFQCITNDGNVLWQKRHWLTELAGSTDTSIFAIMHTFVRKLYWNPYENNIVAIVRAGDSNANSGYNGHLLLKISPTTGALTTTAAYQTAGLGGLCDHIYLRFINNRIYLFGSWRGGTSTMSGFVVEMNLSLNTVFRQYYYVNGAFYDVFPAPGGGWYAPGYDTNTGYLSRQVCVFGLSADFQPLWKQIAPSGSFYINGSNGGDLISEPFTDAEGYAVYHQQSTSVANLSGSGKVNVSRFDHETSLSTDWAFAGGHDWGNTVNYFSDPATAYKPSLKLAIGWSSHYRVDPVGGKLVIFGIKGPADDEGERWMNVGGSFEMMSRTDLQGRLASAVFDLTPDVLPIRNDGSELSWGFSTHTISSEDTPFTWEDGSLVFLSYVYRDPEYIAPVNAGSAGITFYTGNGGVQKLSAGALFEPDVIFHANRSAVTNKIIFGGDRTLEHFERWNASSPGGVTVNGIVASGTGFFTISGRTAEWNSVGNNYAALGFAALAGALTVDTYTGNGSNWQTVNHSLGVAPELVIVNPDGAVGAASSGLLADGLSMSLNSGAAAASQNRIRSITSTTLEIGGNSIFAEPALNLSGRTGMIYSFASSDQWDVGLFSGNGTDVYVKSLGYQPKAILLKSALGATSDWLLCYRPDGSPGTVTAAPMNSTAVEAAVPTVSVSGSGFSVSAGGPGNTGSSSALFLAIR